MSLHPLGSVDPASLVDGRLQLHHAAQFAAAFGQTRVTPRPDDSHRAMRWDDASTRFVSEPDDSGVRAFVEPDPLAIGLVGPGGDISSLKLMGATARTARAWMEQAVRTSAGDEALELGWPDYDMPHHFVVDGRPFQARPASLKELALWFGGAHRQLEALVAEEADAEPVRVWPHHFDIASLIVLARDDDGAPSQTVGVGLSPGDDGIDEPYWYVNAWGYSDSAAFPELQAPGHTHREGWSGFVLTATELIEAGREGRADPSGEADRQTAALNSFLERAVGAAKALFAV